MPKKKIMIICDYFLPGFKGGGGTRTVINLVDRFHDRYDFFVITRNHDGRTDLRPYSEVKTGAWNDFGKAKVFYLPDAEATKSRIAALAGQVDPDLVFLNSVFSTPSISYLRGRRQSVGRRIPVVLASCGELSKASLALKSLKKRAFLMWANAAGLHRGVIWKPTSAVELKEIVDVFGEDIKAVEAPDLPPRQILPAYSASEKPEKISGSARFVCVARVVPIKNIGFFLELLKSAQGSIIFDIIGPLDDAEYLRKCEETIATLPQNITVNILGPMPNVEILKHLTKSHFFVLPSLSENFGYVFIEALAAGCPLLISDRTIWNDVETAGGGFAVPLEDKAEWMEKIERFVEMNAAEHRTMSAAARNYAIRWLSDPAVEQATASLLEKALNNEF